MAKASEADLKMAMELCGALDSLTGWSCAVPEAVECLQDGQDSEPFDRDDREQCVRVLGHLIDLADRASLMRVVWGCAVMLDPRNRCVDPDSDVIEHHPDAKAGIEARRARHLGEWSEDMGAVLWWSGQPGVSPWLGLPNDPGRPVSHALWTPVLVPHGLVESSRQEPALDQSGTN